MPDQVQESLQDVIKVVKGAVSDAKKVTIAAIRNDEPWDPTQLRRLQKLQSTLEATAETYSLDPIGKLGG